MMEFLTFESFISTEALIIFYYIGAVLIPVGIVLSGKWLLRKIEIFDAAYKAGKEIMWESLSGKQKTKLGLAFIVGFMFMELFWRMLFEFLIAYMQIRDALLQASF